MDNSEVILEAKKVADIKGIFVVPDYQRGYRWGEQQVKTLLSDIWGAAIANKVVDYCLQPIVVKRLPAEGDVPRYELIDGQQRITTTMLFLVALRDLLEDPGLKDFITVIYFPAQMI